MMENVNMKDLQNIHSTEGKLCDVKIRTTYVRECDSSEVTGKRKGSSGVEREDDIEFTTSDNIWKERTPNNVKKQRLGENDGKNCENSGDCEVCDVKVNRSIPSSFVCTMNADYVMPEYKFCEDKNPNSEPVKKFNTYQVCNETLDISNTKNDLILPLNKQDCPPNIKCTSLFKEESKTSISNHCKQVRFSHAVNVIPDISFTTCTSVCHPSAKLCCEMDLCTNKNENDSNSEVSYDLCCSSTSCDEVNGNMSSYINKMCICQHSDSRVVHTCRQMFESAPHNFKEKNIFVTRNNNFPSISLPFSDAHAKVQRCSICFVSFTDQKVAQPETCSHKFCLDCLQQWAKNMNTCPMDRLRFNTIFVKDRLDGKIIDHIPVKNSELEDDDMDNNVDYCEVCRLRSVGREEILISCYRCGRMYHLTCLSTPVDIVTFENWVCPDCEDC